VTNQKGLRITRLEVENFKRVKAVRIDPDGNMILIGGENGEGKSSVLDSIAAGLGGGRQIQAEPVHTGADKARIDMDLGVDPKTPMLRVVRTINTERGGSIKVMNADGSSKAKPQSVLDPLIGPLSFDPLSFIEGEPRDQAAMVRSLAGVDTTAIDEKRTAAASRLADARAKAKSAAAAVPTQPPLEVAQVSVLALSNDLTAAEDHNRKVREATANVERCKAALVEAQQAVVRANAARDDQIRKGGAAITALEALGPEKDTTAARESIRNAEATNAQARAWEAYLRLKQDVVLADSLVTNLKIDVETLDKERADLMAKATLPVEGLAWTEDGVLFNGHPLDQASQAEKIRVAMAVGLAMNPGLRVVLIHDGSLLGPKALALIAEIAEAHDAQVFIERVGDGDPGAIVIEDGMVRK
jgi:DNA repair exonuclease SbcCD ATPase subunit